ncbi:unknown; predicted coding region [Mycoplasmopsis pulmonis]|uniref:Uncharacterized protein n=1 Tax=Mycoplasmopsis pulmonis (strain UAB CTIP) TaxID=272635 RepID=Q98PM5_MYCPU|nr:unknown; predicted coding region [Mycoplasmopsis pulmonis]
MRLWKISNLNLHVFMILKNINFLFELFVKKTIKARKMNNKNKKSYIKFRMVIS